MILRSQNKEFEKKFIATEDAALFVDRYLLSLKK